MKGVVVTMPVLESTQAQTLLHLTSRITDDPSSIIMVSTNGFSFSIIFSPSFLPYQPIPAMNYFLKNKHTKPYIDFFSF